jgi:REP element-mobilizing transposase RayT/transcriptional regulator with XRE-family HTH domain
MPRKPRSNAIGFYHILNRGVDRGVVYKNRDDFLKFLEIMQEASEEYGFGIYAFCLMRNHYHLLLKTTKENLSTSMQKINARYSIYFNNRYKRVGPLWQGRFKSWAVRDDHYLATLVRYIEYNPIKAKITKTIGSYEWAMSSHDKGEYSMLDFEWIEKVDLSKEFDVREQKIMDEFLGSRLDQDEKKIDADKHRGKLEEYFTRGDRDKAIYQAVKDGYTQKDVAVYLGLSYVSISKIMKNHRQKISLFRKMRDKGIFWSYDKGVEYGEFHEGVFIEHTLKYGDFDDIQKLLGLFGKRTVKRAWEKEMKSDKRFIKLNYMIARVFLGMDVESDYFKEQKNARFEKLRLLAS